MRTRDLALYISRKSGRGQPLSWRVRAMLSTLLLLFISFALAFSIVLIESMAQGLDDVLQLLGGGSVIAYDRPDDGLLGSDDHVFRFQTTSALASSGTDSALVTLRGVDDDYFFPRRSRALDLETIDNPTSLEGVTISRMLAEHLAVEAGDRIAMMVYDASIGRVRPVLLFIEGIYSTGYGEYDEVLAFTSTDVVRGVDFWELVTQGDPDELVRKLRASGIEAYSYREMNRSVYENIAVSVTSLDVIVALIALLAGFFAVSLGAEYVERDRRDIALMMLCGHGDADMAHCYVAITMRRVLAALVCGMLIGIGAACVFIPLLSRLDAWSIPALQSYVTNMDVHVPVTTIVLVAAALVSSAYVSLRISLHRGVGVSLYKALVS